MIVRKPKAQIHKYPAHIRRLANDRHGL